MIDLVTGFLAVYSLVYIVFSVVIAQGVRRFRTGEPPADLPTVSVVVCARNEEDDMRRCMEHLAALDYPADRIEIIIVDDESEDGTPEILAEFAGDPRFRILSTKGEPRDLPAKQRPLNHGIMSARGDIVLVTDADIAVRPGWAKSHVAAFEDRVGITGGLTRVETAGGLFNWLQNSDLVVKLAAVMGSAGLGIPITVMGNNIAFRRAVYLELGGFDKLRPSIVEDMALMNAVKNEAGYKVGWARGEDGVAVSTPEPTFASLMGQRRRWVHEIHDFSGFGKFLISVESIMGVCLAAGLVLAFLSSPWPLVTIFAAWNIGLAILLKSTPASTWSDVASIPFMMVFQLVYGIALLHRTLFGAKTVVWKGRTYGK